MVVRAVLPYGVHRRTHGSRRAGAASRAPVSGAGRSGRGPARGRGSGAPDTAGSRSEPASRTTPIPLTRVPRRSRRVAIARAVGAARNACGRAGGRDPGSRHGGATRRQSGLRGMDRPMGAAGHGRCPRRARGRYFVKLAIDRGWIAPVLRCGGGAVVGAALAWVGWRLYQRGLRPYGAALIGGGAAVMYVALWAAVRLYDLLLPTLGLGLVALLSLGVFATARLIDIEALGTAAALGAFAAPAMLGTSGRPDLLLLYAAFLAAGLGWVAERGWRLTTFLTREHLVGAVRGRPGGHRVLAGPQARADGGTARIGVGGGEGHRPRPVRAQCAVPRGVGADAGVGFVSCRVPLPPLHGAPHGRHMGTALFQGWRYGRDLVHTAMTPQPASAPANSPGTSAGPR